MFTFSLSFLGTQLGDSLIIKVCPVAGFLDVGPSDRHSSQTKNCSMIFLFLPSGRGLRSSGSGGAMRWKNSRSLRTCVGYSCRPPLTYFILIVFSHRAIRGLSIELLYLSYRHSSSLSFWALLWNIFVLQSVIFP